MLPTMTKRQITPISRYHRTNEERFIRGGYFRTGWMEIKSFPHRELRPLRQRLVVLITETNLQVSAPDPCDYGLSIHAHPCLSPR